LRHSVIAQYESRLRRCIALALPADEHFSSNSAKRAKYPAMDLEEGFLFFELEGQSTGTDFSALFAPT
jgi:hypothetical protein